MQEIRIESGKLVAKGDARTGMLEIWSSHKMIIRLTLYEGQYFYVTFGDVTNKVTYKNRDFTIE